MRTTSSLESQNSQMNRFFDTSHPSIFQFIDCLKSYEFMKGNKMDSLIGNNVPKKQLERKRKRDVKRNEKINFFTQMLEDGLISVGDFLEAMGNRIILPYNGYIYKTFSNFYYILKSSLIAFQFFSC